MSGRRGKRGASATDVARVRGSTTHAGTGLSAAVGSSPHGAVLSVVVTPRASVTAIDRVEGNVLRVRVAAPPVDGAANAALVRFLADVVGVARSGVAIVAGASGRRKRVAFAGVAPDQLIGRLEESIVKGR